MTISDDFKHVGQIDVDAGCVWIGDPCYILKDKDEERPIDLGEEWSDFTHSFLERIGYTEEMDAYQLYHHRAKLASHGFDPDSTEHAVIYNNKWIVVLNDDGMPIHKYEINRELTDAYIEANPFVSPNTYVGYAAFKHDAGHAGMGVCVDTNEGDGTYPVYIKYGKNGRPSQILIDFGDNE